MKPLPTSVDALFGPADTLDTFSQDEREMPAIVTQIGLTLFGVCSGWVEVVEGGEVRGFSLSRSGKTLIVVTVGNARRPERLRVAVSSPVRFEGAGEGVRTEVWELARGSGSASEWIRSVVVALLATVADPVATPGQP